MPRTLGAHFVRSAYGWWLPGDSRGHWSEAWDHQIGYLQPHMLHPGDPVRLRMAQERMKHPPVKWSIEMRTALTAKLDHCASESPWNVTAYAIDEFHFHALFTDSPLNMERTVKWLGQEMTKAVHRQTNHARPVFCKGHWLQFIFEQDHWDNLVRYIGEHNLRRGLPAKPYGFLHP